MSVIAGCSLFNGVILLADCRITIQRSGKPDILCDNVQKLFPLTKTTALGFVGDLKTASTMIRELFRQQSLSNKRSKTNRLHPLSIIKWLPRYFRSSYRQLAKKQVEQLSLQCTLIQSERRYCYNTKYRMGESWEED